MPAAALILDRTTWEPVCCLHTPEGSPGNLPVKKVASSPDIWEAKFDDCKCVAHEAGFTPDGKYFTMMNNIRQNNMAVFDTSDPDPRKWKKFTFVKDPNWVGEYPSPFHLCFSMDGSKMFVSVLYPKPGRAPASWSIPRPGRSSRSSRTSAPTARRWPSPTTASTCCRSSAASSGCRAACSSFTQDTLEPVGYLPNFGGHHDCVIVPTKVEH